MLGIVWAAAWSKAVDDAGTNAPPPPAATAPAEPGPAEQVDQVQPGPGTPAETASQESARRTAESDLETSGFSRSGLIDQLTFDGFTQAQAQHAANVVGLELNA